MNNSYTIYGGGGCLKTKEKNIYPHESSDHVRTGMPGFQRQRHPTRIILKEYKTHPDREKKSVISGRPYPIFSSNCVKTCPLKARNSPRVTYHVVQKVGNHVRPVH